MFAEFRPAAALADDPASDTSAQAPRYSTGKAGSRLKWIAQRPEPAKQKAESIKEDAEPASEESEPAKDKAESLITPTQYLEPDPASLPSCGVRTAQSLQPSTRTWSKTLDGRQTTPAEKPGDDLAPIPTEKKNDKPSLLDQALSPKQHTLNQGCTSPKELKRINELGTNIEPPAPPPNWTEDNRGLPLDCPLGDEVFQPRAFAPLTYTWTASALCHKPLYFEDVQLERYGHMAGPWVQPFASAANFFCTFPILPYKMGLELPNECIYTLGYYRPGSCAPYLFDPLPISIRGLFFESGAWVAGCALIP